MWELFSFWSTLGPPGRAITLACLGLAIGSFLSVLRYRLPRRQDPVRGRSHCPTCEHALGIAELVPVFSYLVQRGRCRHCQAAISPVYPLLELATGAVAAVGGAISWSAGLALLGALVVVTWVQGRSRARAHRVARGFMLVEVVVAFLLLALSIGSVLDLFGIVRHAVPAGYRRTEAIALARAEYSMLAQGLTTVNPASTAASAYCASQPASQTGETVLGLPEMAIYTVDLGFAATDGNQCQVTITVTCPDCRSRYGEALAPVTVRGYIRKKLQTAGV
jgi:Tfp pilus assembly protein PilV